MQVTLYADAAYSTLPTFAGVALAFAGVLAGVAFGAFATAFLTLLGGLLGSGAARAAGSGLCGGRRQAVRVLEKGPPHSQAWDGEGRAPSAISQYPHVVSPSTRGGEARETRGSPCWSEGPNSIFVDAREARERHARTHDMPSDETRLPRALRRTSLPSSTTVRVPPALSGEAAFPLPPFFLPPSFFVSTKKAMTLMTNATVSVAHTAGGRAVEARLTIFAAGFAADLTDIACGSCLSLWRAACSVRACGSG